MNLVLFKCNGQLSAHGDRAIAFKIFSLKSPPDGFVLPQSANWRKPKDFKAVAAGQAHPLVIPYKSKRKT